jgi:hypothetical protein
MTSTVVKVPVKVAEAQGLIVQSSDDGAPWLACDLEVATVAEIVGLLIAAKRTGRLDVVDQEGTRSLYFETGEYTGSSSTHKADRLGEVLWRSGKLSLDQLLIASEAVKEGKMIGRVLIELGFLEPATLRRALVDQAVQVFEASCLVERGHAVFRADVFHKHPIRFGVATRKLVDSAVDRARDYRELVRRIGSLERSVEAVTPAPAGTLGEAATALLQLVLSSKNKAPLTAREVIDKAALGPMPGTRALVELRDKGFVMLRDSAADAELRVKRLCAAINLVMAALDEGGFGVGDTVREYLERPPPAFEEALSGLSLAQPLEEEAVVQHARFIGGGTTAMARALQAVLDDALMQAHDTLPAELTKKVLDRVKALGA